MEMINQIKFNGMFDLHIQAPREHYILEEYHNEQMIKDISHALLYHQNKLSGCHSNDICYVNFL